MNNVTAGGSAPPRLLLSNPVPWPDPVDGATLLDTLRSTYKRFVVLPDGAHAALALWTVHAHAHDAAMTSPVLVASSPAYGSGKSTLVNVISHLVPRPLPASNVTTASVFRAVEEFHPTLLIDEGDTFLRGDSALVGILNSGHSRASATVLRADGDNYQTRAFSTWSPKLIALNGALPDTLASRSITILLRRKLDHEKVEEFRRSHADDLEVVRRMAARWSNDHIASLADASPDLPAILRNRTGDNWRPLIAIADEAGGAWPEEARRVAALLSGDADAGDTTGIRLLTDLRVIFRSTKRDVMRTEEVLGMLCKIEESPWGDERGGKGISAIQLANHLRPFGVRPTDLWLEGRAYKGYEVAAFADVFQRYLPPEPREPRGVQANAEMANSRSREESAGLVGGFDPRPARESRRLAGLAGETDKRGAAQARIGDLADNLFSGL